MRICIISNSHAGALKRAIDASAQIAQDHEICFFAAAAGKSSKFIFANNIITTPDIASVRYSTNGAFSQIAPGDFDALVFYAIQLEFGRWMFPPEDSDQSLVTCSAGLRGEIVTSWLADSQCFQLAYQVATSPDWRAQVIIAPAPLYAAPPSAVAAPFDLAEINAPAQKICTGFGAQFVPQPPKTIDELGYTHARYATDSRRLNLAASAHPETELRQMNAAYGALMLRDILAALR